MTEFSEQPHARARGRVGEDDAVRWLAAHGFEIVERNVVNHGGEIDVVAKEGETLCFIEIKARDGKLSGPAIAAVTPGKQRRLSRAAGLLQWAAGSRLVWGGVAQLVRAADS